MFDPEITAMQDAQAAVDAAQQRYDKITALIIDARATLDSATLALTAAQDKLLAAIRTARPASSVGIAPIVIDDATAEKA